MNIVENIEKLLQTKFEEPEFQDCFLIEINLSGKNTLEVFVDGDAGIDLLRCRALSRYLESFIDEHQWLGEEYTLEVSSPGVGRPLKFARQYARNIGRSLEVTLLDDSVTEGELQEVRGENEIIVLTQEIKVKEGKKNVKQTLETEIPISGIKQAIVKINFK
jgi:ribosome maturation factor RimP